MLYTVVVNKRFRYIRVYKIVKRIEGNENAISKALAAFVDKFFNKNKQEGSL